MWIPSLRASIAVFTFACAPALAAGCVADRPSRNGVFTENQYVKKSFLIEPGDGKTPDRGWFLQATVIRVSTPNPLGALNIFPSADTGAGSGLSLVRFRVTGDKLQMLNVREISTTPSVTRTEEVMNAWPAESVDLKYRVNLDGEKSNFYEENQELDWQIRQWVKVHFAKNDMSDIAPLGGFVSGALVRCTDLSSASATLAPNSFKVEEHDDINQNYMQWAVSVTVPVLYSDPACVQAYGDPGVVAKNIGRQDVTFELMYSMMRAKPIDDPATSADAYVPLAIDEKDPIRHKYGVINIVPIVRDSNTQLLASRQLVNRWNPRKPIVYYFYPGVPEHIKDSFLRPNGIKERTNQLFEKANVAMRVDFLENDDARMLGDHAGPKREFGDVRYSFVRWLDDVDANTGGWSGYGPSAADPRTGEVLNARINLAALAQPFTGTEWAYQVDFFLKSIGASWGLDAPDAWGDDGVCSDGDVKPLKPSILATQHNATSTLYTKMQQYLQKPATTYGNLGPQDLVAHQDDDFFRAYYTLLPYQVFADPDANRFVIREGGKGIYGTAAYWDMLAKESRFQQIAATVDRGEMPFDTADGPDGVANATAFANELRNLTVNHTQLQYAKSYTLRQQVMDVPSAFNFVEIMAHTARHCVNGHWQTKDEWVTGLLHTWYDQIAIHEFGHTLGLQHNFMASVDKNNWATRKDAAGNVVKDARGNPVYTLYTSSVMEYGILGSEMYDQLQWGPYDMGALGWIYSNDRRNDPGTPVTAAASISGQVRQGVPYNDPYGFDDKGQEIQFLYCHHEHIAYTPLCRPHDGGTTPSEIVANAIEQYEWQYNFTNYRVYRKYWNNAGYANRPAGLMTEMRRFLSQWLFDWRASELADTFRRIGIKNPDSNGSDLQYFGQLTNKFNTELSTANSIVAAFHKAIIQQSTGERPVRTLYDRQYGDVTQQGIILDKLFAMQSWVGLWPSTNYDPNQSGAYFASYSNAPDALYQYVAEDAVDSMIGGQYDAFPYFVPLAVSLFAQDTHSPSFTGRVEVRDWIGGQVFYRLEDFLSYFRDLAVQNQWPDPRTGTRCASIASCAYDPRALSDGHNEFFGPDKRLWAWAYVANRNTWIAVQKERNTASYVIVRKYNDDVVFQLDDGAFPGAAFATELPLKYFLDAFRQYN